MEKLKWNTDTIDLCRYWSWCMQSYSYTYTVYQFNLSVLWTWVCCIIMKIQMKDKGGETLYAFILTANPEGHSTLLLKSRCSAVCPSYWQLRRIYWRRLRVNQRWINKNWVCKFILDLENSTFTIKKKYMDMTYLKLFIHLYFVFVKAQEVCSWIKCL